MARTPDGPPPSPTVQRLRIRYAKRGRLRFSSHRDFQRALERALRRADVPIAYSAGFTPHPKVSYANAAPTGAASEAEYLEIGLAEMCDPERLRLALDESLPPGLDILQVVEASGLALAERLEASQWLIEMPGVEPAVADEAAQAFLAAPAVEVSRMTKSGLRTFDARAAVLRLNPGRQELEGALTAVLALLALAGGILGRAGARHAAALFGASAFSLALLPVAILFYDVRYAAPVVALLAAAAAIGTDRCCDLLAPRARRLREQMGRSSCIMKVISCAGPGCRHIRGKPLRRRSLFTTRRTEPARPIGGSRLK